MSREMKNSGIQWIGDIPKGWKKIRIKHIFEIIGGNGFKEKYQGKICGDYPFYKTSDINADCDYVSASTNYVDSEVVDMENYNIVPVNSIVVSKIGAAMRKNHRKITTCDCCIDNNLQALHPIRAVDDIKYLYYLLKVVNFEWFDNNGTIPSVNNAKLKDLYVPWISFPEQQKIASFLDRKCAEIDEMIALQEKIVEELKAYKQSVITEAVTKGLNPEVPMKDSEIDWIGEIPEHWQTVIFKSLFCIKKVIAGRLGYDVLSVTQQGLKVKDLSKNEGQVAQDYSKYQIVNIDDFVMNHMDLLTGYIDCAIMPGVTSPDYRTFVNRNNEVADNNFFLQIFQKCYKDKTFYHLGQGVSFLGRWRLPKEQLNAFVLPLPPLNEQKEIANYLNDKCSEIDTLIKIKLSKIDSLKEYKKSIIYEYVTGKKEVTE